MPLPEAEMGDKTKIEFNRLEQELKQLAEEQRMQTIAAAVAV